MLCFSVLAASFVPIVHRTPAMAPACRPRAASWPANLALRECNVQFSCRHKPVLAVAEATPQLGENGDSEADSIAAAKAAKANTKLTASAVAIMLMLVSVKTFTDLLTNSVARPPATAMALVTELTIFPLTAIVLTACNFVARMKQQGSSDGAADFKPPFDLGGICKASVTEKPGRLMVIGLAYALDSVFYFFVQSNVGAVTYTVLAQTKIFFTVAMLRLRGMLGKLQPAQKIGLISLFAGANLVALKDVATGVAAAGNSNRMMGIAGLLLAQAVSALANVAYERRLREPGSDVWVRNVQLTGAISIWLVLGSLIRSCLIIGSGGTPPSPSSLLTAFCAPWVWLVVMLKASSALLIALTIKAGGNVLYAISKPWPVVFATLATCFALGRVPSVGFLGGIILSVTGIGLYYYGKAQED